MVRGFGGGDRTLALAHGAWVIHAEQRVGDLFELGVQRFAATSGSLEFAVSWTYWNSEFTVVGSTLLFVYLRRNEAFSRFRNWILLANVLGLVGYALLPTAPPRLFPDFGFGDMLADFGGLNHGSGLVELAANPYAAMPSLHAADALIVGVTMALVCRRLVFRVLWALWPAWVWFVVMATGNHFWLDCAAGALLGAHHRRGDPPTRARALLVCKRSTTRNG